MTHISEEYSLAKEANTYLIVYSNKSYNKLKACVFTLQKIKNFN